MKKTRGSGVIALIAVLVVVVAVAVVIYIGSNPGWFFQEPPGPSAMPST